MYEALAVDEMDVAVAYVEAVRQMLHPVKERVMKFVRKVRKAVGSVARSVATTVPPVVRSVMAKALALKNIRKTTAVVAVAEPKVNACGRVVAPSKRTNGGSAKSTKSRK